MYICFNFWLKYFKISFPLFLATPAHVVTYFSGQELNLRPSALEVKSLNHWATREVLAYFFLKRFSPLLTPECSPSWKGSLKKQFSVGREGAARIKMLVGTYEFITIKMGSNSRGQQQGDFHSVTVHLQDGMVGSQKNVHYKDSADT